MKLVDIDNYVDPTYMLTAPRPKTKQVHYTSTLCIVKKRPAWKRHTFSLAMRVAY